MNPTSRRVVRLFLALACLFLSRSAALAQAQEIRIVQADNIVEMQPAGAANWVRTQTNQVVRVGDHVRTGPNSRLTLQWSDQSVAPFGPLTEVEVLAPHAPNAESGLWLFKGIFSFFHRDKPGRIRVITRGAVAGIDGTEFVIEVVETNQTERTILSLIDGKVHLENPQGALDLTSGQQAIAEPGQPPLLTAGFIVNNVLQWAFYYPAVLDVDELPLGPAEQQVLATSLANYRTGELLAALAAYPTNRMPASDAERIYRAALLLSVGQAARSEAILSELRTANPDDRHQRLATALRTLIAAVRRDPNPSTINGQLATELLASSYHQQSLARGDETLTAALRLARQATAVSPKFGFAWTRVAELEFSFGRIDKATEALDRALELTPRNPQAHALKGFLLAARNQTRKALESFDRALAIDFGLGNAWLGRGLTRIRRGEAKRGRGDLLVAAAIEPRRAILRSYLAKGFAETGRSVPAELQLAEHELDLAKEIDANDPTAWLYSALLKQQQNRINEAVEDLEHSQGLNENRSLYRSQLLLDQDRAVRSANLASIYRDAGMFDVSIREAARAVNADYANYSAHLFLADSYVQLRDPQLINLRYETPAQAEYLVANLLAPVSAGPLSSTISQQEYSNLLERDRLGVVSSTEYLSRGAWFQNGAQFGTFGNLSYDLEAIYHSDNGQRPNNDLEARLLTLQLRQQLTSRDSFLFRASHLDLESGDVFQYYDSDSAAPDYRIEESQEPIIAAGYHHEWSPGVHTLFLATRIDDTYSLTNSTQGSLLVFRPLGDLTSVWGLTFHEHLRMKWEIYSAELQQIWQTPKHFTVVGGRFQYGHNRADNFQILPSTGASYFPSPPEAAAEQNTRTLLRRSAFYAYHSQNLVERLQIIAGLSYDLVNFPENPRLAPISDAEDTVDQLSPKAGFIWSPVKDATLRFAYTRSISGADLDQSFQLEPSQVAGFVQSFRSIMPESVVGTVPGARFETLGLSLDWKLPTKTYLSIGGEILKSKAQRTMGAFLSDFSQSFNAFPSSLREDLDYDERSLLFSVNQLLGDKWAIGARYRLSHADLRSDFADVPDTVPAGFVDFQPREHLKGLLHQLNTFAIYDHRSGFFGHLETLWYAQDNAGYVPERTGDDFWQFNAFVGYRFFARKAELRLGVLNLADQDYRLNPLNVYNELPRRRTVAVRLTLAF